MARKKTQPTAMQAKALELIREGKTPRSAMLEVGYTEATASHPSENLLRTPGVQSIIEQYRAEYERLGIIPTYYVEKVRDLIEADKVHSSHTEPDRTVPDWSARAKGLEIFRKDIGLDQGSPGVQLNVGEINVTWQDGNQL